MKKELMVLLLLILACGKTPGQDQEINLRIGTYNLRMQQLDKDTPDRWELRREKCLQSIVDNDCDILGIQEINGFAQSEISSALKKEYAAVFFCPYSADGTGSKASGMLYKKDRLKLVDYHYFWLNDTPYEPSYNDHYISKGEEKSYIRGGTCALFKDRQTGKYIFFINHHGILNAEENLKYAHVLIDMEKEYNPNGYPSFLVGDFNARVPHPSHQIWREYWNDSADNFGERQCTMNAFNPDPQTWDKAKHIDFVYYRNIEGPVKYVVNQKLYDGRCASDHFPVWADFRL